MLPKKNRTDKKTVNNIFKQGKFLNSPYFTFKFIKSPDVHRKISFIVPKSLSKLATRRNALRRKGYEAVKSHLPSLPRGIAGVFIFKKQEDDISKIENEIKEIFSKLH